MASQAARRISAALDAVRMAQDTKDRHAEQAAMAELRDAVRSAKR